MSNLADGRAILKCNNSVVVQNSSSSLYGNFMLTLFIVYELNKWPRNPTNNITLKNCLFGIVKLTRNKEKTKFSHNGPEIAFDRKGWLSFGNEFARDVVIFGVDNSSSSHTDHRKNNFLGLGKGPNDGINNASEKNCCRKNLVLILVKANAKFCISLCYNGGESYLYVNKTEICKFEANDNISWYNFCLGSISKDFTTEEQSEIFSNSTVYDFSSDHSSIKKEDIFNIH